MSDNPFTGVHGPVRAVPQDASTAGRRSSASRASGRTRENVPIDDRGPLAPAVPARRALHPRHAQVPRQHGRGHATRRRPARRACSRARRDLLDDARRCASRSRSSSTASTRTSRGARRRSTSTCTATRATRARRSGVTPYGFARNFTPELLRRAARRLRRRGHDDGPLARPLHGPLPRARARTKNTVILLLSDHGYLLGERGYTGKVPSQLHPELAQVPFVIVHPDDRAAGEVSQHFASTHDVGPTVLSMVGIEPPAWMNGTDLAVHDGGQGARPEARLPLRRHVQPLLHPHRRLGPDRRQPRQGAHALRPAHRPARVRRRGAREPEGERRSCTTRSSRRPAGRCRTTT